MVYTLLEVEISFIAVLKIVTDKVNLFIKIEIVSIF